MTASLTPEYLDALVARGYAHQPRFDAETVKLILDMADAITALRDRENAVVAAAFEAAALDVEEWANEESEPTSSAIAASVRALTPADATAALDRMLLTERNKVRREMAEWIRSQRNDFPATGEEFANAILATIETETGE